MSNEIKEKEEYEKYARDHRKELDAQEVKIGDVVKVLVGQFAGETGIVIGIIACDKSDYTDPYYEIALNCEVPEKYKCRKTLMTPNNVIGGLSAHEFEVIGNRAPKQPSMEIKQGDKVRVSSRLPRIYERFGSMIAPHYECKVVEIDDGMALLDSIPAKHIFLFPLKYLVKVDAEAKEARYHEGEKVCYNGYVYEIKGLVGKNRYALKGLNFDLDEDMIEPYEPYTDPTEQTEAEKPSHTITIPVEVDLTDSCWDAYTADLAKEIALKVANKYNDPKQAAEYAVKVAKAVVEGLKRK